MPTAAILGPDPNNPLSMAVQQTVVTQQKMPRTADRLEVQTTLFPVSNLFAVFHLKFFIYIHIRIIFWCLYLPYEENYSIFARFVDKNRVLEKIAFSGGQIWERRKKISSCTCQNL